MSTLLKLGMYGISYTPSSRHKKPAPTEVVDAFYNTIYVKPQWAVKVINEKLGLAEKWAN
jgi:hypothetical protein